MIRSFALFPSIVVFSPHTVGEFFFSHGGTLARTAPAVGAERYRYWTFPALNLPQFPFDFCLIFTASPILILYLVWAFPVLDCVSCETSHDWLIFSTNILTSCFVHVLCTLVTKSCLLGCLEATTLVCICNTISQNLKPGLYSEHDFPGFQIWFVFGKIFGNLRSGLCLVKHFPESQIWFVYIVYLYILYGFSHNLISNLVCSWYDS